jgi:hypothetical protein
MGLVIGMDEAGYGPNFGPLVVSVTAWEVPGHPRETNFWKTLQKIVARVPSGNGDERLHVADSKQVYSSAKGLAPLERSVLSALRLSACPAGGFLELADGLTGRRDALGTDEPWYSGCDLPLPHADHASSFDKMASRWHERCHRHKIRLKAVRCDVVSPARFNSLTRLHNSKGAALSSISLALLRQVWDPDGSEPVLIIADKHGGRNRYDQWIVDVLDGQMIFRQQESREMSCYRVGSTEIRFETRAESHFPVALASMVSKYVRELSMTLFNRYWSAHVPGLKPTAGYPVDSYRFRSDIAAAQERLGISDDIVWRER